MTTHHAKKTDSVNSFGNGDFLFCKELNKGFTKNKTLDTMFISEYTVEQAIQKIESLDLNSLNQTNTIEFSNGEEKISYRDNLEIMQEIKNLPKAFKTPAYISNFVNEKRSQADYFSSSLVDEYTKTIPYNTGINSSTPGYRYFNHGRYFRMSGWFKIDSFKYSTHGYILGFSGNGESVSTNYFSFYATSDGSLILFTEYGNGSDKNLVTGRKIPFGKEFYLELVVNNNNLTLTLDDETIHFNHTWETTCNTLYYLTSNNGKSSNGYVRGLHYSTL